MNNFQNYINIMRLSQSIKHIFVIPGVIFGFCIPSVANVIAQGLTTAFLHENGSPQTVRWMNLLVFGDGNHDEHHEDTKKYKLKYDDISGWLIENILMKPNYRMKRSSKWQLKAQ
mgnify:CR=1 FL=1